MRYWTVEEAREYLPRLRELVTEVQRAARAMAKVASNGHEVPGGDDAKAAMDELTEGDIILRDLRSGLIDFHALGEDDVVYLLCWRLGEDDLEWWHMPEDGFPGRQRLPREPGPG